MVKRSIFVQNNRKSQRTILNSPGYALSETSINQVQEVLTKFYSIFAGFSRNQTGYTPSQKLIHSRIGRSGPTVPAVMWSQIQRTVTRTTKIV